MTRSYIKCQCRQPRAVYDFGIHDIQLGVSCAVGARKFIESIFLEKKVLPLRSVNSDIILRRVTLAEKEVVLYQTMAFLA
jgi:hypothetical protein